MYDVRHNRHDDLVLLYEASKLHFYGCSVGYEKKHDQIIGSAFARKQKVLVARAAAKVVNALPDANGAGEREGRNEGNAGCAG